MATMETEQKTKISKNKNWIWMGLAIAAMAAGIFMSLYGLFSSRAAAYVESPFEQEDNIQWIYKKNQILYRDLYHTVNVTEMSYADLYYPLSTAQEQKQADSETEDEEYEEVENLSYYREELVANYFRDQEAEFSNLNELYDYLIKDLKTGKVVTNTGETAELNPENYHFYLKFQYDENGNVTLGNVVKGDNGEKVRKLANEAVRSLKLPSSSLLPNADHPCWRYMEERGPVNCEVTYGMTHEMWRQLQNDESYTFRTVYSNGNYSYSLGWTNYGGYMWAGCYEYYAMFLLVILLLALLLPYADAGAPYKTWKLCRLPLEGIIALGILILSLGESVVRMAYRVSSGRLSQAIENVIINGKISVFLAGFMNFLLLLTLFAGAWYVGICLRGIREDKLLPYIKSRSLIYKLFPYIKAKLLEVYAALSHFDVTKNARKLILKVVLLNALVLFIICSFWVAGFTVVIVYSILLYFLLKKYVSDLQKKYGILLNATNQIAEGNLNVAIIEDLGVFEPFKPQIIRIQRGFRNAVEEEVKSQRMKAELITNVSHDLKTPLTAITTYIGLLKDENITPEQRTEYLDILERKSQRLKVLIEDLFEVSKATTQNATLNIMDVDIMNLVKQVELEMSDKLESANLEVRMNLTDSRVVLPLDSQKTYRIYENLFGNIAKYALPGTRVYVNGFQIDDTVVITLKNITAEEINVSPEELTDRFVRGDVSRNTEGSGLGLAIAKSFTELQGGNLEIDLDGDLFKVTTTWKIKTE